MDKPDTPHYQHQDIEPIDYIRGLGDDVFLGFCVGNIIKYVSRYRHKGTVIEDLKKARQYIDWMIDCLDK